MADTVGFYLTTFSFSDSTDNLWKSPSVPFFFSRPHIAMTPNPEASPTFFIKNFIETHCKLHTFRMYNSAFYLSPFTS